MDLSSIPVLSGVARAIGLGPAAAPAPATTPVAEPASTATPPGSTPPAVALGLRELAQRYDLTDITPREFSELVEKLGQAGALPNPDLQTLMSIRLELDRAGVEPDTSLDLVDYLRRKQEALEGTASVRDADLAQARAQRNWIEKLAELSTANAQEALDVVA